MRTPMSLPPLRSSGIAAATRRRFNARSRLESLLQLLEEDDSAGFVIAVRQQVDRGEQALTQRKTGIRRPEPAGGCARRATRTPAARPTAPPVRRPVSDAGVRAQLLTCRLAPASFSVADTSGRDARRAGTRPNTTAATNVTRIENPITAGLIPGLKPIGKGVGGMNVRSRPAVQ